MMKSLCRQYGELLTSRPLVTKIATSIVIKSTGDLACQMIEKGWRNLEWDKERTARQGFVLGCLVTPMVHWYVTRVMAHVALKRTIVTN